MIHHVNTRVFGMKWAFNQPHILILNMVWLQQSLRTTVLKHIWKQMIINAVFLFTLRGPCIITLNQVSCRFDPEMGYQQQLGRRSEYCRDWDRPEMVSPWVFASCPWKRSLYSLGRWSGWSGSGGSGNASVRHPEMSMMSMGFPLPEATPLCKPIRSWTTLPLGRGLVGPGKFRRHQGFALSGGNLRRGVRYHPDFGTRISILKKRFCEACLSWQVWQIPTQLGHLKPILEAWGPVFHCDQRFELE